MKRTQIAAIALVALAAASLFGWGAIAGAKPIMGIVARPGDAAIAAEDQSIANGEVTITSATSPRDAFVVVHQSMDGKPGMRLGYASIPAGTSTNVKVTLDPNVEVTPELLAAIHIDRGTPGELDFDMANMEHSFDRPFFVNGKEVAVAFAAQ